MAFAEAHYQRCPQKSEKSDEEVFSEDLRFLASEEGPAAVEYAVMLALIIIVCLTAITTIGQNANSTFDTVAQKALGKAANVEYETVGQSFKAIGFKKTCISLSAFGLVPRGLFLWGELKPARIGRVRTHETTGP